MSLNGSNHAEALARTRRKLHRRDRGETAECAALFRPTLADLKTTPILHNGASGHVYSRHPRCVKRAYGVGQTLAKARRDRRIALADYLDNIATCVENIRDAFATSSGKRFEYCHELWVYASNSKGVLTEMLNEKKAFELTYKIQSAFNTREAAFEKLRPDLPLQEAFIQSFSETIGHLHGTANMLRTPVPIFEKIDERRSLWQRLHRFWRVLIGGQ